MLVRNKEIWLKNGYEIFAISGQGSLKIEPLARMVGKNKSSFYHHFADIELFIDALLEYHIEQSKVIARKEQEANSVDPDLINILLEHKIDLLFNRQLKINQNIKKYALALEQSNKNVGDAFINVWMQDLNLQLSRKQMEGIFNLAVENFFLQINIETINYHWLSDYFKNLKKMVGHFA